MRTVDLSSAGHHRRHAPIVESALRPPPATDALVWRSEDDTRAFAERLAARPVLRQAFVELRGELGAGKTTFARHLLRALGVRGHIKSPTYAVVEPHEAAGGLRLWHFDFYRFEDPREWEDAGLRELFASPGLKLVEWPDKARGFLPTPDLVIDIAIDLDAAGQAGGGARRVSLTADTPRGRELLTEPPT